MSDTSLASYLLVDPSTLVTTHSLSCDFFGWSSVRNCVYKEHVLSFWLSLTWLKTWQNNIIWTEVSSVFVLRLWRAIGPYRWTCDHAEYWIPWTSILHM